MIIPLVKEVGRELTALGVPAKDVRVQKHYEQYGGLLEKVSDCCIRFRQRLVQDEATRTRVPLLGSSFWDVTPKYRCDALQFDLVYLADQLAWAIGFASVYLNHAPKSEQHHGWDAAEHLCMYHLDFAIRLASSGWDRIALLLDLAFDLGTGERCDLSRVLIEIPKKWPRLVNNEHFKWLKKFRDKDFLELEAGKGRGRRHEVTHLLAFRTRFLCESLDCHTPPGHVVPPKRSRLEQTRDSLLQHYHHYVSGINQATNLICAVFP